MEVNIPNLNYYYYVKYYEKLSEKYRKMIPLEMVYIPVPKYDSGELDR